MSTYGPWLLVALALAPAITLGQWSVVIPAGSDADSKRSQELHMS